MATNLRSCFSIEFLEQLLKFLVYFTLLKYVKSWRSYGFLITKELIFGFQILDLKDHLPAPLVFHWICQLFILLILVGSGFFVYGCHCITCFMEIHEGFHRLESKLQSK